MCGDYNMSQAVVIHRAPELILCPDEKLPLPAPYPNLWHTICHQRNRLPSRTPFILYETVLPLLAFQVVDFTQN